MSDESDLGEPGDLAELSELGDLSGSAVERLAVLDGIENPDGPWLARQLRATLQELAAVEPIVDAERERREDY